jgi:drug/metabolite transporter (DMT)-like permease
LVLEFYLRKERFAWNNPLKGVHLAIAGVAPLPIAALPVPFLGEKVARRRWCAIAIGFAGLLTRIIHGGALNCRQA